MVPLEKEGGNVTGDMYISSANPKISPLSRYFPPPDSGTGSRIQGISDFRFLGLRGSLPFQLRSMPVPMRVNVIMGTLSELATISENFVPMVISFNGDGKQVTPTRKNASLSFVFRAKGDTRAAKEEEAVPCRDGKSRKGKSLDLLPPSPLARGVILPDSRSCRPCIIPAEITAQCDPSSPSSSTTGLS